MSKSFVSLNFKEGRSLAAKDSNGASDPYVKAFVPGTYPVAKSTSTVKSKVIKANLNPKWNFIVNAFQGVTADALSSLPPIKVEIWDKDTLSDDFMGVFEIPSSKLATNPSFEEWIDVKPRTAKDKVTGQILVSAKYVEVKYDPEAEKRLKENSKLSLAELSKLEKEFKKSGNSVQSKEDLLHLLIKLDLLQPVVAKSLQRSGKENLTALEKTILGELYKDKAFMDLIAQTLFDTMDSDRSGSIDWQELVIGLSVLTRGSKGDTARLKFKVIDLDNSGSLSKDEYKSMAEKDLRSTFAAMRIGFKVGFRVGIEQAASSKREAEELKKLMEELPFEKIFISIEALFTSPELLSTLVDMVFTYADTDKNGTISEEEYVRWSEDLEQQALFSLQVQQTLAPFLEQLAMDVQQEFVTALQEYM